jgi:hypothetical protein
MNRRIAHTIDTRTPHTPTIATNFGVNDAKVSEMELPVPDVCGGFIWKSESEASLGLLNKRL